MSDIESWMAILKRENDIDPRQSLLEQDFRDGAPDASPPKTRSIGTVCRRFSAGVSRIRISGPSP
jgi:hypothetical protein